VIVDYLGKFHSGSKTERHDLEIARMTGAFADMAITLNVPVLLLVQLNRESVKGGQERRPTPSDLRDSGAIEQDAAQVLFLYRDEKADEAARDPTWMQILLELNRFGPTGDVGVSFQRETGRWRPWLRMAS
jgi:replicative DNA helicase